MARWAWLALWSGVVTGCTGAARESVLVLPEVGQHPGVVEMEAKLVDRLAVALAEKGDDYVPRTQHLREDGSPLYTNRLIVETSPYLLQHAHNPVNWYPWGEEAFERAKRENKPVLMSIGYSTCHWCHVMEEESFEDVEIATYINTHFIAIKVDREERPDIDEVYMTAVQLLTGRGGWPMTIVMTPDKQPFFGGTYFPPRDGDRGSRVGFLTLLEALQTHYADSPDQVLAQAKELSQRIQAASQPARPASIPSEQAIVRAVGLQARNYDPQHGGFGQGNKFPRPTVYSLLLRYYRRTGDAGALGMVATSLRRMAEGGMYDQVGGGFHRYSTDIRWLVPHFEKMLYDNAQLVPLALEVFQITKDPFFSRLAVDVLEYVEREMSDPNGGFYSATDADSMTPSGHREEGWFFTWTPDEIRAVVGDSDAELVMEVYGVKPGGNFEGRSIFQRWAPVGPIAQARGLTESALEDRLQTARSRLYTARAQRPPPLLDDKVLTAWNGLMVTAFARAGFVLDRPEYTARAQKGAEFLLSAMRDDSGGLKRSYSEGKARHAGTVDDYAFLIAGLLDVFEVTSEAKWLQAAEALQERQDLDFWDRAEGGYFTTANDHETLIARVKPDYDGAEPSGNSVALHNLFRLSEWTGKQAYRTRGEKALATFSTTMTRRGPSVPWMLSALDFYLDEPLEVVVVGEDEVAARLVDVVRGSFLPNRVVVRSANADAQGLATQVPLLEGKVGLEGSMAYTCRRGLCERPTADPAVFQAQLARPKALTEPAPAPLRLGAPAPKPYTYDPVTNQYWDPEHKHWHTGKPPER